MRIYLDCCCYNRLFDDHRQASVRQEAAIVSSILSSIGQDEWELVGSEILTFEMQRVQDANKRRALLQLLSHCTAWVEDVRGVESMGRMLTEQGIPPLDARHWAAATLGMADVFLTVDKRLYRKAMHVAGIVVVPVMLVQDWYESYRQENEP